MTQVTQKITAHLLSAGPSNAAEIRAALGLPLPEVSDALMTMETGLLIFHDNTKWDLTPAALKVIEINLADDLRKALAA